MQPRRNQDITREHRDRTRHTERGARARHATRTQRWHKRETTNDTRKERNKRAHTVNGNTAQTKDAEMGTDEGGTDNGQQKTDGEQETVGQTPTTLSLIHI
eukprot:6298533-Prorocentrum_lima.AAC.1